MLTDDEKRKQLKTGRRRSVVAETNKHWSDSQKIEAVQTFLMLGSIKLVHATLKIPEQTLFAWKRSEWWGELVKELQVQDNIILSNKLKKIVDKSHEIVLDRLENGDFIYDQKAGKLIRKPVGIREAHKVALDFTNQRMDIKTTEQVQVAEENIMSKLEKLAKSFEEFATNKPAVEVTDVVFVKEADDSNSSN